MRRRPPTRRTLLRSLAIAMLLPFAATAGAAVRTADGSGLTLEVGPAPVKRAAETRHALRVDRRAVERAVASGRLLLPTSDGTPLAGSHTSIRHRSDGLTIVTARVATRHGPQSAVLTLGDGVAFGFLPQRDGPALRIETRDGRIWLVEGDNAVSPTGIDYLRVPPPTAEQRAIRRRQDTMKSAAQPAAGPNVDVVVLYTPTLMSVWGSQAAMQARIAHLEAITNQAYVDSEISQTVTVVGTYLVDYVTTADNHEALDILTTSTSQSPGSLARDVRAFHGADLVTLLREFDRANHTSCGVGWLGGYDGAPFDPDWGYSVSGDHGFGEDHCGEWTFAHELGHNMGAHHDFDTAEGDHGAYTYSRGFRRTLSQTSGFATVMAYSESPQVRLGQFSNPRLARCLGEPCGDAVTADNARGLSEAAPSIAAFGAPPASGLPELRIDDAVVVEGNAGQKVVTLHATLSSPAAAPIVVNAQTSNGTAGRSDYVPYAGTVTIPAGATAANINVSVRGDTIVERDEFFAVDITDAPGARIADAQGVITIDNDEVIPTFSLADVEVVEGDADGAQITFTATLSAPSTSAVTFDVDISEYGIDGARAGEDYVAQAWDDLTIPAGQTTLAFSIAVIGDDIDEPNERLRIVASGLTGAEIARDWARGWIMDDDTPSGPLPELYLLGAPAVVEGTGGNRALQFTVQPNTLSTTPIGFDANVTGGTATNGVDFAAPPQSIVVPAGADSVDVIVPVIGDALDEADETVVLTISNPTGATLSAYTSATGTIHDDDGALPPLIAADDRRVLVMNSGGYFKPLENDNFQAARMGAMTMQITGLSAGGSAFVETSGFPVALPDTINYTPATDFLGEETIGYRVCESEPPNRCAEGRYVAVVRPGYDAAILDPGYAGHQALTTYRVLDRPEARYAGEYAATPLAAPRTWTASLGVDATPESPFDGARDGTSTVVHVLPLQSGVAVDWRVLVDAFADSPLVDVYVGIDSDLGQDADPAETVCRASRSFYVGPSGRCELAATQPGSGVVRYWVLLHNRGAAPLDVPVDAFEVPLIGMDGTLTITGQGSPDFGAYFMETRIAWSDPTLLPSDRRAGYVAVRMGPTLAPAWIPVRIDRVGPQASATALRDDEPLTLALAAGAMHDRLFVDVPVGATQMTVTTQSDRNIDLHLVHAVAPSSASRIDATAIAGADASATGPGGNETIIRSGSALTPGRWYVVPVNADTAPASLQVHVDIAATAVPPRPGSYFNAGRSGHGVFLYPAADQWAGLWYTYFEDGTPTWYYLQGAAPDGDGLWTGGLYRAMWDGDSNSLTAVGAATVTPVGPDEFLFTYSIDGETGSEPMAALGRGCPTLGGGAVDASSHWFNPATAGTGHSVQLWGGAGYEFYASFVYDADGVPRFLTAENSTFAGADATLPIDQLTGFCPLCERGGMPARETVGTLRRIFAGGTLQTLGVTATFAGAVRGAWNRLEPVQPLGGPGTTQGCSP